ncbi:MAG: DUF6057 family protein [Planctomycetota bacterium]|jgi:hypothetical protein
MFISHRKLSSPNLGRAARTLLFFILFYLYLWLEVDLRLMYHGGGAIMDFPVFFRGWTFFCKFLLYPGGLVEYLSAFLSQFLRISWAGPVVVTLQAWLICLTADYFLKALKAPLLRGVRFLPPILLLTLYTRYIYHFTAAAALLVALLFLSLYLRLTVNPKLPRWLIFLALSVIVYAVVGGAYLLFAALCVIYELFFNRRWPIALTALLSAPVLTYGIGVLVYNVSIIDAFSNLTPFSWKTIAYEGQEGMMIVLYVLYLLLPSATFVLGLGMMAARKKVKESRSLRILSWYSSRPFRKWCIESSLLLGFTASAVLTFHDTTWKTLFEIDYYACHRMWPQILAAAPRHPNSYLVVHAVNRALYQTGRLNQDLFRYHQSPDTLFLTTKEHDTAYWKKFDVYLDLGHVNIAEHELTESLGTYGSRPLILKRLALGNIAKRSIGTARVYLRALSKTLFDADWANSYLEQLQSDSTFTLADDDQIQRLRRHMLATDYGFSPLSVEQILLDLLGKNMRNRMAFEYLMSWYMLTGQLEKFVQNLYRLNDLDYSVIPPLYEEAILLYTYTTGKAVNLHGLLMNPQSIQRFEGFRRIYSLHDGKKDAAFQSLAKAYGDTFFFYSTYGLSGLKK